MPTSFQLKSIYEATGDSVYVNTGIWKAVRGMKNDSMAIVYLLKTNDDKTGPGLAFLQGDGNVLFFLDKNRNLMVGNNDHSYTLNRKSK